MSINSDCQGVFPYYIDDSSDRLVVERSLARLRQENILSEENRQAVQIGGQEHGRKICEGLLNLHRTGLLTPEYREALLVEGGALVNEAVSLIIGLNWMRMMSDKKTGEFVKLFTATAQKYGVTAAKEIYLVIKNWNQAGLLTEEGVTAGEIFNKIEYLFNQGNLTWVDILDLIGQEIKKANQSNLPSAKDFFHSPMSIAPQLTFEEQSKIQKLLERFKEDALAEGMDESEVESYIGNRLMKTIERGEKIRKEREEKLLQANQEIANESSEIVKKSSSRVQFAKQYTVRMFHAQTKDWVGFSEQRDVDTVRTRECYAANYSVDYKKSLKILEEGKKEIGAAFAPYDDCLQSEPLPPSAPDTRLLNFLADVSISYFSNLDMNFIPTSNAPSYSNADSEIKKIEWKIDITRADKLIECQMDSNLFDLECVEDIIKKLESKAFLTVNENRFVKKLSELDRIHFQQKKPAENVSSFMKLAQKTDRLNREKKCREYFSVKQSMRS